MCVHSVLGAKRIARQYWRAWIETWVRVKVVVVESAHRPPVLAGVD